MFAETHKHIFGVAMVKEKAIHPYMSWSQNKVTEEYDKKNTTPLTNSSISYTTLRPYGISLVGTATIEHVGPLPII